MRKYLAMSALLVAIAGIGDWLIAGAQTTPADPPRPFDRIAGEALYQSSCAACHGANLKGQPDWQSPGPDGVLPAPPHDQTGHTWHHPDGMLFDYTKLGGKEALARQGIEFNSGMPGFGDQLTDEQIQNILAYIKSTWPERQRTVQAERSAAARQQKGD